MGEQAGLIYNIDPQYVATPNTDEGLRLFRNALNTNYYVKKQDGTIELFTPGGPVGNFVPYTGATQDVDLNNKSLIIHSTLPSNGYIELDKTGGNTVTSPTSGIRLAAGNVDGTIIFNSSDNFVRTFNTAGITSGRSWTFPNQSGTIALLSDLTNFVTYTGATADLDLGAHDFTAANVYANTYTPVLTNTGNIGASTAYVTGYYQVGNIVTVFGKVDIQPLVIATQTELELTLPVPSVFAGEEDLAGTANSDAVVSESARVMANGNNNASIVFKSVSISNDSFSFQFSYQIKP